MKIKNGLIWKQMGYGFQNLHLINIKYLLDFQNSNFDNDLKNYFYDHI